MQSKIEWTEYTWNPVTGCSKISPGCAHCYAERMALRLQGMGHPNYRNGFKVTVHEHMLELPLRWRTPRMVFVNSMSDLFHPEVPESFVLKVFEVMRAASWHIFQVLTKRSERLLQMDPIIDWPQNVWMGVTVENQDYMFRAKHLVQTHARLKFLSLEPLLGTVCELPEGVDWVIVGGESGPGARPLKREWVIEIRDRCISAGIPFFFKQWGGVNKKQKGRLLDGQLWDQMPHVPKRSEGTIFPPLTSIKGSSSN